MRWPQREGCCRRSSGRRCPNNLGTRRQVEILQAHRHYHDAYSATRWQHSVRVARGAMQVVPMHANTAPEAGSGKSYLFDLASAIATGEIAPVIAAGRTEEETEKRLSAELMAAQPIVSIDNLNGSLAATSFAKRSNALSSSRACSDYLKHGASRTLSRSSATAIISNWSATCCAG
jgi:hypothetical protein